ncbi:MAG: hypothetical protein U1C97_03225 [Candidatus Gracilibacteria bacterium]|nr:hypothetical protein [bacterium]MDZ4217300.1 hypothetical protein [Candidatus Gracilibacteria bacterium]
MNLYGVWVDYAHAFLVKTNPSGENMTIHELVSEVEPHHHSGQSDGEHLTLTDQGSNMRRRSKEMDDFCDNIISSLRDADEIIILGPGIAKSELEGEIREHHELGPKLKAVETADKLSEEELKKRVSKLFHLPR